MTAPYTELERPLDEHAMLCRGCLADSGEMKNIFEWGLVDDFCNITEIQLLKSESVSSLLCVACERALLSCKRFKAQCQSSHLTLRSTAKKKPSSEPTRSDQNSQENNTTCVLYETKLIITITAPDMLAKIYLSCPYCQERYIKRKDLLLHLVRRHNANSDFSIDLQFYCSVNECKYNINTGNGKFFQGRKFLNQHYQKVHTDKIYKCNVCSQSYPTNKDFERHLKNCNVYFCQICNLNYKTNEKLLVHLMRRHPDLHKRYKEEKALKRKSRTMTEAKKLKTEDKINDFICDSPKRSFATQTLKPEENIKNDVTLSSWHSSGYETKTDEISTQTVFEDLLSLKSQTSEDDSIFFSETVSLSDIQTQTFPLEFGLSRSNKETITSETQSPDLSIKETQTCFCLYDSPKLNFRLFDSVSSSPSSNLTSTETQTLELRSNIETDVLLSFSSAETQTSFEESAINKVNL